MCDADGGAGHRLTTLLRSSCRGTRRSDLNSRHRTQPLTAFIASTLRRKGFLGQAGRLDAAIAPILILGWFSQKQLVRGLTFGAVK